MQFLYIILLLFVGFFGISQAQDSNLAYLDRQDHYGQFQVPRHHAFFNSPEHYNYNNHHRYLQFENSNPPNQLANSDRLRILNSYRHHYQPNFSNQYNRLSYFNRDQQLNYKDELRKFRNFNPAQPLKTSEVQELNSNRMPNYPNNFQELKNPIQDQQHTQNDQVEQLMNIAQLQHYNEIEGQKNLVDHDIFNYPEKFQQYNQNHEINQQGEPERLKKLNKSQLHDSSHEFQQVHYRSMFDNPTQAQQDGYPSQDQKLKQPSEVQHFDEAQLHNSAPGNQQVNNHDLHDSGMPPSWLNDILAPSKLSQTTSLSQHQNYPYQYQESGLPNQLSNYILQQLYNPELFRQFNKPLKNEGFEHPSDQQQMRKLGYLWSNIQPDNIAQPPSSKESELLSYLKENQQLNNQGFPYYEIPVLGTENNAAHPMLPQFLTHPQQYEDPTHPLNFDPLHQSEKSGNLHDPLQAKNLDLSHQPNKSEIPHQLSEPEQSRNTREDQQSNHNGIPDKEVPATSMENNLPHSVLPESLSYPQHHGDSTGIVNLDLLQQNGEHGNIHDLLRAQNLELFHQTNQSNQSELQHQLNEPEHIKNTGENQQLNFPGLPYKEVSADEMEKNVAYPILSQSLTHPNNNGDSIHLVDPDILQKSGKYGDLHDLLQAKNAELLHQSNQFELPHQLSEPEQSRNTEDDQKLAQQFVTRPQQHGYPTHLVNIDLLHQSEQYGNFHNLLKSQNVKLSQPINQSNEFELPHQLIEHEQSTNTTEDQQLNYHDKRDSATGLDNNVEYSKLPLSPSQQKQDYLHHIKFHHPEEPIYVDSLSRLNSFDPHLMHQLNQLKQQEQLKHLKENGYSVENQHLNTHDKRDSATGLHNNVEYFKPPPSPSEQKQDYLHHIKLHHPEEPKYVDSLPEPNSFDPYLMHQFNQLKQQEQLKHLKDNGYSVENPHLNHHDSEHNAAYYEASQGLNHPIQNYPYQQDDTNYRRLPERLDYFVHHENQQNNPLLHQQFNQPDHYVQSMYSDYLQQLMNPGYYWQLNQPNPFEKLEHPSDLNMRSYSKEAQLSNDGDGLISAAELQNNTTHLETSQILNHHQQGYQKPVVEHREPSHINTLENNIAHTVDQHGPVYPGHIGETTESSQEEKSNDENFHQMRNSDFAVPDVGLESNAAHPGLLVASNLHLQPINPDQSSEHRDLNLNTNTGSSDDLKQPNDSGTFQQFNGSGHLNESEHSSQPQQHFNSTDNQERDFSENNEAQSREKRKPDLQNAGHPMVNQTQHFISPEVSLQQNSSTETEQDSHLNRTNLSGNQSQLEQDNFRDHFQQSKHNGQVQQTENLYEPHPSENISEYQQQNDPGQSQHNDSQNQQLSFRGVTEQEFHSNQTEHLFISTEKNITNQHQKEIHLDIHQEQKNPGQAKRSENESESQNRSNIIEYKISIHFDSPNDSLRGKSEEPQPYSTDDNTYRQQRQLETIHFRSHKENVFHPATISQVCQFPKSHGPCHGMIPRYYYDKVTKRCDVFMYGGCYGNGNNFAKMEECESVCMITQPRGSASFRTPAELPKPLNSISEPDLPLWHPGPDLVHDVCHLEPIQGPCSAVFRRYFFNTISRKCEVFLYGGCYGNANNFFTPEECEFVCQSVL